MKRKKLIVCLAAFESDPNTQTTQKNYATRQRSCMFSDMVDQDGVLEDMARKMMRVRQLDAYTFQAVSRISAWANRCERVFNA